MCVSTQISSYYSRVYKNTFLSFYQWRLVGLLQFDFVDIFLERKCFLPESNAMVSNSASSHFNANLIYSYVANVIIFLIENITRLSKPNYWN